MKKSALPFVIAVPFVVVLVIVGIAIAMQSGEKAGKETLEKTGVMVNESVQKTTGASFGTASGSTGTNGEASASSGEYSKKLQQIKDIDETDVKAIDKDIKSL